MNHGWEYKRLGDVCEYNRGLTYSKDAECEKSSNIVLRANNINLETHSLDFEELKFLRDNYSIPQKYKLQKDSILICMSSGSTNHLGKVAFVDRAYDYAYGGFMGLILPKINPKYLFLFMISDVFRSHLDKLTNGININNLKFSTLQEICIPVPPIELQETIVSELNKINELIEVKRSQLADLDLLAQSLFYEMFGDPIDNSKGWNLYKLGDCVEFKNGLNFTPSDNGNEIKCLGVGNFKSNRYITDESLPSINIVELVSKEYLLKDGDIVFVRSNGNKALIGRSILYASKGADATFSGFCIRCRFDHAKYDPLYMVYLLSSKTIRHYMTSQGKGCNMSNINQKILSAMPFIVPPIELQDQFAAKIKMIEEQKNLINSSIADLQILLASRMDYWFNNI